MFLFAKLLFAFVAAAREDYCELPTEDLVLPTYLPSLIVTNSRDEVLTKQIQPHLEFAQMQVHVAYSSLEKKTIWKPHTIDEAAFALREMLPSDFYNRLLKGYNRTSKHLINPNDPAVNERISDVASFIKENWGTLWSKEHDSFKLLGELVDYSSTTGSQLSTRCETQ